jgi:glycogen synthase
LAIFAEPSLLSQFRRNAMNADFSWERQASEYVALYEHLLHEA